jgi:predicted CXXCH cytochrome family protein
MSATARAGPAALAAAVLLGMGTSAWADITTTKHNFQLQTNAVHAAPGATEDGLCVFCHTPHKGASSLLLWNHQFSANNYSWADVTGGKTTGGTTYPTNLRQWTGSTAKCLSCHDGTVSVGALYWSNATGRPTVPIAGADASATGAIGNVAYIIPDAATGADLAGNHPVGVPYSFDQQASTYNGITTGPDVKLAQWVARPGGVKIFGAGGGGAPIAGAAGIECASCHDPHGTANVYFLRVTKSQSQLCLSCHIK